jgi:hypothetical protein
MPKPFHTPKSERDEALGAKIEAEEIAAFAELDAERAERAKLRDDLEAITSRMDVPAGRRRDVRWLSRNIAVRNRAHPEIGDAVAILSQLLRGSS